MRGYKVSEILGAEEERSRDRSPVNEGSPSEALRKRRQRGKSPVRYYRQVRSRSAGFDHSEEATVEEEKNMELLQGVSECWRSAREDLRIPIIRRLDWRDSWELYNAGCLPRDQAALLQTLFTRIEEHCAHSLIQDRELRNRISEISGREEDWERQRSELEARIKDLEEKMASEVAKPSATGKEIGFEAGHAARKIIGMIKGRKDFIKSEEFAKYVFKSAVETKATDYLMQGFDRCKAEVTTLNEFVPDFDASD
ncbi:UNVERIFIED_CONTAM: hypothetical protein Sindi_1290600 [Sesamum indicum]